MAKSSTPNAPGTELYLTSNHVGYSVAFDLDRPPFYIGATYRDRLAAANFFFSDTVACVTPRKSGDTRHVERIIKFEDGRHPEKPSIRGRSRMRSFRTYRSVGGREVTAYRDRLQGWRC